MLLGVAVLSGASLMRSSMNWIMQRLGKPEGMEIWIFAARELN